MVSARLSGFLFVVLAFASFPGSLLAQKEGQALVDSLQQRLPALHDDTLKVNVLNSLSYNYFFINPDNGVAFGRQALLLAQRLRWVKGVATAYKNIGNAYTNKSAYDTALGFYSKALSAFEQIGDQDGLARVLGNIGSIYDDLSDYTRALEYDLRALRIYEQAADQPGKARIYGTIGNLYESLKKYNEALKYQSLALDIHLATGDRRSVAIDLGNIGNLYGYLSDYRKALEYNNRSLAIYQELGDSSSIANKLQNIGSIYAGMKDFRNGLDFSFRSLGLYKRVNDRDGEARVLARIGMIYYGSAKAAAKGASGQLLSAPARADLAKALDYTSRAIAIFREIAEPDGLMYAHNEYADELELAGNYREALAAHRIFVSLRDSVLNSAKEVKFANLEKERALQEKEYAEERHDVQLKLNRIIKQKEKSEMVLFTIAITLMLAGVLLVIYQRRKVEQLLLNILPASIADRLKNKEHPIADHFADASIIFIDMAEFTRFSEDKDPKVVVTILNDIFTRFDMIAGKHGLEKIKTIGDCYMAVAGLPERNPDHPRMAADMAIEVMDSMRDYVAFDGTRIRFRIGIDCGTVVAGVIGKKKFIYDIWGDAVNTASRMESSGIPGEIHCTDSFHNRLPGYRFESRGEISVKSKGLMHTWLLKGK